MRTRTERKLFEDRGFKHILEIDGAIYLIQRIREVTAFCCPYTRLVAGQVRVDYDFGIVALRRSQSIGAFLAQIETHDYVALPRTIQSCRSLEMLVKDGRITGWLVEDMQRMMLSYSHDVATLNVAVERGELPYMAKFRRVFPDFFDDEFWLRTASI